MNNTEKFMQIALNEAEIAFNLGEVPVGAVIVRDNIIIAEAHNTRETENNTICHAEINAINIACEKLGSWRLNDCTIYVTLEPCPMCAGAIINSRIEKVVYGACDEKMGAFGSVCDLSAMPFPNSVLIKSKVLENQCLDILQSFFKNLRKNF